MKFSNPVERPLDTTSRFDELSLDQLSTVSGGFLPLLGLLGSVASIGGQVAGAIGQSKAKKAEQLNAQTEAAGGGGGGGGGAPAGGGGGGGGSAAPQQAAQAAAPMGDWSPKISTSVQIS